MIGLSFSLCVSQIARGVVRAEDVQVIFASTRAETREDWESVIESYANTYWSHEFQWTKKTFTVNTAVAIARKLLSDGKIRQTRLENNCHYPDTNRTGLWVREESQIEWVDDPELYDD